jgi:hypothetical protein
VKTLIQGIFARTELLPYDFLELLQTDPENGNAELARLAEVVRTEFDGSRPPWIYRLTGPEPAKATPMQYGGFFLEKDREFLQSAKSRGKLWIFVDAGPGAYLDFVSDLPADGFAWDAEATGFPVSEMRKLRPSIPLCSNGEGADFPLTALRWKEMAVHG